MEAESFHVDRQKDMTKIIAAFRNFANEQHSVFGFITERECVYRAVRTE